MRTVLVLVLATAACEEGEICPDDEDRRGDLVAEIEPAAHEAGDGHDGACEDGDDEGGTVFGPPTEAVCPEGSTLTWDSFGQAFMQTYCTECHSSTLTGAARQGAPLYHDFDTLAGVLPVIDHVEWKAAAGPAATNELMPPAGNPTPTLAERRQLGEWLACELAAM